MSCSRRDCAFLRNTNKEGSSFCCLACKQNKGHGSACQKNAVNPKRSLVKKNKDRAAIVASGSGITSISLVCWGKSSAFGEYLVFNFKTGSTKTIAKMDYKLYSSPSSGKNPTLLIAGGLPFFYNNSQIIYVPSKLVGTTVYLQLTLTYTDKNKSEPKKSGTKYLDPLPYEKCNYFTR